MARRWEEFDEPGTPRIARLHVSMSPTGTMLLSRNTYNALRQPSHVVMLWDSETDTVGTRPVPPRTLNAFHLYDSGRSGAYRFHALRFLVKHDIRLDYTVRFPTAAIEDGVLLLELKYRVRSPPLRQAAPAENGLEGEGVTRITYERLVYSKETQ